MNNVEVITQKRPPRTDGQTLADALHDNASANQYTEVSHSGSQRTR